MLSATLSTSHQTATIQSSEQSDPRTVSAESNSAHSALSASPVNIGAPPTLAYLGPTSEALKQLNDTHKANNVPRNATQSTDNEKSVSFLSGEFQLLCVLYFFFD